MRTQSVFVLAAALFANFASSQNACKYDGCQKTSDCCGGFVCYELVSVFSSGMCMPSCSVSEWSCRIMHDPSPVTGPPPPTTTPVPAVNPPPPATSPPNPNPPPTTDSGDCNVYGTTGTCSDNCGSCFNPGGRPGVVLDTQQTGYYNEDEAYACLDWSFGSQELLRGEADHLANEGESVYFGIGTFGATSQLSNLGSCYRMTVEGVDRDIIVQAINTGGDVHGNQFDLQMGNGGFGAFNRCVGDPTDMFAGTMAGWGQMYGGTETRPECSDLPNFPRDDTAMRIAGDDLVKLCEYSFDKNVRREEGSATGTNPTITHLARVKCPAKIVELTQLQRTDDPSGFTGPQMDGFPNTGKTCQGGGNWNDLSYCLTRMLDCKKPSASFIDNIDEARVVAGKKVVQPCTIDGYTRIDVQCGCANCYC
ncbi:putative endoglucanase type K [Diplonema papillatum]|nr:putative endoglucanase type K [Diplonema papillatum]